jgi:hypothetical protein
MLKVPVHGDDDVTPGKVKSGLESWGLAEISPQPNDAHALILLVDFIQDFGCLIPAPVIHKDEFVRLSYSIKHVGEPCVEWPNILLLIVQGHDNRDRLAWGKTLHERIGHATS